jgi:dienelactone hydrolase
MPVHGQTRRMLIQTLPDRIFVLLLLGLLCACGSPARDVDVSSASADTSSVVDAFPTQMSGRITGFTGRKVGDSTDPAVYARVTGHANYGVGAAASPFFEDQTLDRKRLAARRQVVRKALWDALLRQAGDPRTVSISWQDVTFVAPLDRPRTTPNGTGYVKQLFFFNGPLFKDKISGVLLIPNGATKARGAPAIVYNHYHGGEYWTGNNEVDNSLDLDWSFPGHGSWGDYLIDEGYVVFAVDVLGFNHRRIDGAARERSTGDDEWDELGFTEQFAKTGRSRFAMRTFEDLVSLELLKNHPLVDPARISAMGMSMGCIRTLAMAALAGEKLAAAVALGTFPRWQELAKANILGAHRNSHFFTGQISDMSLDTESFVLAASGTNFFAIMGDSPDDPQDGVVRDSSPDPSSPGWPSVFAYGAYVARTLGEKEFRPASRPGLGHTWSPELADQAIAFLKKHDGRR